MRESAYQSRLVKKLKSLFPNCFVVENDPARNQGIPDLLILFGDKWAMLEVKLEACSPMRPNQDYYVEEFGRMSYAAFIYPENEAEILHDLQLTFGA